MQIKGADNKFKKHLSSYKKGKKLSVIFVAIIFYSSVIFMAGALTHRQYYSIIKEALSTSIKVTVLNYLKGLTAEPVEKIAINIKFKDFKRLQYERKVAFSKSLLFSDKYVPATIHLNDRKYKVKLRLKGDYLDHLQEDKWSFRIKVRGNDSIFGMKQFSIHHPKTRNYMYEWVFHKVLKREGVISLRYEFINVMLNGKDLGIYALEEHFEKRLIEHNKRKEGPIIRFSEDLLWDAVSAVPNGSKLPGYGTYMSSNIDAFQTKKILRDSLKSEDYFNAISLLESFRNGTKSTSDVFDIEKLSSFFAITDIMGAQHGAMWNNTRYYYNPITSKLEPIGFDGEAGTSISILCAQQDAGGYYKQIFGDKSFYEMYISKLARYSNKSYIDSVFHDLNPSLREKLAVLHKEFPYYYFGKEVFYDNQSFVRVLLNPKKAIHSYLIEKSKNQIELAFGNIHSLPIEILSVTINDTINIYPEKEIVLRKKLISLPVEYQHHPFHIPKDIELTDESFSTLRVNYKIYGTSDLKTIEVFPWKYLDENLIKNDFIRKPPNINKFDFINIDKKNKIIRFMSGLWEISQDIHIPNDHIVYINENTILDLINSASIISYSPLNFFGSEENPIVITSSDSTGQGIFILNTEDMSFFDYVHFDNLSNPSKNGWDLSGAITFYEADVSISHCIFSNNRRGDDYLNIVRSKFDINNTSFSNIKADAFDSDFSKGTIFNSSFINCGNDAIDVSGTNLIIKNIFMDNIGDKGLSSGENSLVIADNVKIFNSEIAICSKDMSEIKISDINLQNDKIGFAVFQKKSEFGPGIIEVSKLEMKEISIPYLIETHSSLTIDGKTAKSNNESVKDVLYGVKYGKVSN